MYCAQYPQLLRLADSPQRDSRRSGIGIVGSPPKVWGEVKFICLVNITSMKHLKCVTDTMRE